MEGSREPEQKKAAVELSPLARERLARMGALSQEEKDKLQQSGELDSLLSEYFKGSLDADALWKRLKNLQEQGQPSIAREMQMKLADTLRLQMSEEDFDQRRQAILAIETMKRGGKYPALELILDSIEELRKKYTQLKEQAYKQLKTAIEKQLQTAAQQAKMQGMNIDMQSSLEANVKKSPQWKDFISQHEKDSEEMFNSYMARLREAL
ncbi:MAG: hypothetical protein U9Q17_03005 [Chloroflexota bacterium]|nr:hypothetical protein [Chloroflexota bacterium]